jgi:heptosyltransferase II
MASVHSRLLRFRNHFCGLLRSRTAKESSPPFLRSAAEAWFAAIPRRVCFRGHFRSMLLTQIVDESQKKKAARPKHHAGRSRQIANACGATPPHASSVRLHAPGESIILASLSRGGVWTGQALAGGSFPQDNGTRVGEIACSWVIVGTPSDGRIAAEILEGFQGKVEDLTGKTSLRQLVEYLLKLRVLLTNDTGTMHLADGFGVPLVAVFGSTEPRLTVPRSPSSIVLRHQVECSPCFLRVPAGSSLHARRRTGRSRESRSPTPSLAPRQGSPAFDSQGVWNISVVLRLT